MFSSDGSFSSAASALEARPSKFWWRADTPMLWKRLSLPSGLDALTGWHVTQRALPLKSTQPRLAGSEMALASPARKRSKGASRKISVRSKLAMARPMSS